TRSMAANPYRELWRRMGPQGRLLAGAGAVGVGIVYAGSHTIFNVNGGSRAIVFDRARGVLPDTYGPGTHFVIPWLQRAIVFNMRPRPTSIPSRTGSKDLQMVDITLRILARPIADRLPTLYSEIGPD